MKKKNSIPIITQEERISQMKRKNNNIRINNRAFLGVWIPKEIYLSQDLTPTEKFLLTEISSYRENDKACYASNQHFANFLGVDKLTVSRLISKLKNKGYISLEYTYKPNSKEIDKRYITPNFGFFINRTPLTQKSIPLDSHVNTPLDSHVNTPLDSEVKDTNTVVTNTSFTNTVTISSAQKNLKNEGDEKALERKRRDRELKEYFMKNIWERYPQQHRVGEKLCFSKFKSAIRNGSSKEEVIEGFNTYLKVIEINKNRGSEQYIKRLDNWFASESWKNPNKYMKSQMDSNIEKNMRNSYRGNFRGGSSKLSVDEQVDKYWKSIDNRRDKYMDIIEQLKNMK